MVSKRVHGRIMSVALLSTVICYGVPLCAGQIAVGGYPGGQRNTIGDPHRDPPPGAALQMTSRLAWRTLQTTLPKINMYSTGWGPHHADGGKLRSTGFSVTSSGDKDHDFAFNDFDAYLHNYSDNAAFLVFGAKGSKYVVLGWDKKDNGVENARRTVDALNRLIYDTLHGHMLPWSASPAEESANFQQKADAWRALATKPEVSEEVYKDRLLAEDALKSRDLSGAATHYEAGVASDPTWAQGWYNVALVYAELNDYLDAADCMKRYIILLPNAPDARAAKDNIILWEAKASSAAQADSAPPARPPKRH